MSTPTTSRQVEATFLDLRRTHEDRTEEALRGFFAAQGEELVPAVSAGLVSFDTQRWNRELASIIFERGKDTATDYGTTVFGLLGRSLRFDPDLMDPWLIEVAGNSAADINAMTLDGLTAAATDEDPAAAAEGLFAGLTAVRSGLYATSMTTTYGNFGAHDGARAGGAGTKTWNTNSGNPRSSHSRMSGQTVPLDDTFSNGMRWPGDPSGGAAEVANCVCSMSFGGA